jgi:hypothetical protein
VRRSQAGRSRPTATPAAGASPPPAGAPTLSGPLARSLLARRLIARKAAEGDGRANTNANARSSTKARRPLRVR